MSYHSHSHLTLHLLVQGHGTYWLQSSHSLTKFWQPRNLRICTNSSLFSVLAALALHLWSLLPVRLHHLPYESLTVPFDMFHLVSGITFQFLSDNLVPVSKTLTLHILHLSLPLLPWVQQFHCSTLGSKPTFSRKHSHHRLSTIDPQDWLHGFSIGTVSSEHIRF